MGRRIVIALLVLSVAACTGGPTASSIHSPTPHQQPSPSPVPSTAPSPVPTVVPPPPEPSPTPVSATLSCRLPISNGQPGSGGFVVFPGGTFVGDPASNVVITGLPSPSPGPYGYQFGNFIGLTYDRRYSKWLPVPRQFVTPDESRYVVGSSDAVYVVSVAGGPTLELGTGTGHGWIVLAAASEGVYAKPLQVSQQAIAGLWLLPFSGTPRQVTTKDYWQTVGGGAAFGYDAPSVPSGADQRLLRLDLKTGAISTWFDQLSPNTNLLGFDLAGRPIVVFTGGAAQAAVLTGSNQVITLYDGSNSNIYINGVMADAHGIWLQSGDGIYLTNEAGGSLEKVTQVTGPIAGPCV